MANADKVSSRAHDDNTVAGAGEGDDPVSAGSPVSNMFGMAAPRRNHCHDMLARYRTIDRAAEIDRVAQHGDVVGS